MSNLVKVAVKDWKDCRADVALTGCIFIGIYFLLWVLDTVVVGVVSEVEDRKMEFWIIVSLFSLLMPGTVYGELTDADAGVWYALLPASVFEKYMVMLFSCLVVYPALFTLILAVTDSALVLIGNSGAGYMGSVWPQVLEWNDRYLKIMMCCSFFIYGNLLFHTWKRSKTVIIVMVLFLLWLIVRRYGGLNVDLEITERYLTCLAILINCVLGYFRMLGPI